MLWPEQPHVDFLCLTSYSRSSWCRTAAGFQGQIPSERVPSRCSRAFYNFALKSLSIISTTLYSLEISQWSWPLFKRDSVKEFVDMFKTSTDNLMAGRPTIERGNIRKRWHMEKIFFFYCWLLFKHLLCIFCFFGNLSLTYKPVTFKTYLTVTPHLYTTISSCLLPIGCLNIISNLNCLKSNTLFSLQISLFLEIFFSVDGEIILVQILGFLLDLSPSAWTPVNCPIWSSLPLTLPSIMNPNQLPNMVKSTFDSYLPSPHFLIFFPFFFLFILFLPYSILDKWPFCWTQNKSAHFLLRILPLGFVLFGKIFPELYQVTFIHFSVQAPMITIAEVLSQTNHFFFLPFKNSF